MITKISQSFMKAMREYIAGEECGNILTEQYIHDRLIDNQSDEMHLGAYFEFMLSGALPKGGKVPIPKVGSKGQLLMDYKRAQVNAARVKEKLDEMGLKIVHVGKTYTKGRFVGTIDLIVEVVRLTTFDGGEDWSWQVGDLLVFDVKYSGLLHNYWEKHGWGDERGWSPLQKEYHGTQAKQYHFITGLPFFFLAVGNKNLEEENEDGKKEFAPTDIKWMYIPVDEEMIERHISEGNYLMERFKMDAETRLIPRPSYTKCAKCPLFATCADRHTFPHPVKIEL